ncbi:MAG: hypothetical protein PHG96_05360 [Kiritimatiellae bacterium]|nr:hypothetical protein [Kiritimatiellia bacterium]MDD4024890.1 hypothetical protein [Kiritimatiellia bacterium]
MCANISYFSPAILVLAGIWAIEAAPCHNRGNVSPEGSGVFILNAYDCRVTHNEICDLFYTGFKGDKIENVMWRVVQGTLRGYDPGGLFPFPAEQTACYGNSDSVWFLCAPGRSFSVHGYS